MEGGLGAIESLEYGIDGSHGDGGCFLGRDGCAQYGREEGGCWETSHEGGGESRIHDSHLDEATFKSG